MDVIQRLKEMAEESNSATEALINYIIHEMEIDEMDNRQARRLLYEIAIYGCESGVLGAFIYTKDCKEFFRRYFDDILETLSDRYNYEGEVDVQHLVWTFIEYEVSRIHDEVFILE